jgi:hypothetical protein
LRFTPILNSENRTVTGNDLDEALDISSVDDTILTVQLTAGLLFLVVALKLFNTQFKWWEPIVANTLAGACLYIPSSVGREAAGFVVLLVAMRYFSSEKWGDLIYPVAAARAALFLTLLYFRVT